MSERIAFARARAASEHGGVTDRNIAEIMDDWGASSQRSRHAMARVASPISQVARRNA